MFGTGYQYQNAFNTGSFYVYGLPNAISDASKQAQPKAPPTTVNITDSGTTASSSATKPTQTKKSAAARTKTDTVLMALYPLTLLVCFMFWLA